MPDTEDEFYRKMEAIAAFWDKEAEAHAGDRQELYELAGVKERHLDEIFMQRESWRRQLRNLPRPSASP